MFPPKIIGVIGNLGRMATGVVIPLFEKAGYKVIGSDIKNPNGLNNIEVVQRADVVYFSILPISSVANVMQELIPYAQAETLWLHGTSIQNPRGASITKVLLSSELAKRGIDVGYLHFMIGPKTKSLRGQSIVYDFPRELLNPAWESWLINLLKSQKALIWKFPPETHDKLTRGSQLVPMISALGAGLLWKTQTPRLSEVLPIAGPPCWLQAYGILWNLTQPDIIANIIANHPEGVEVIDEFIGLLTELKRLTEEGKEKEIKELTKKGASCVVKDELEVIKRSIEWHIRLEGDIRGGALCFNFPPEKNVLGLLAKVLQLFDERGLDKTSCMAQELPDGSCTFYIGIKIEKDDPRISEIYKQVEAMSGKVVSL